MPQMTWHIRVIRAATLFTGISPVPLARQRGLGIEWKGETSERWMNRLAGAISADHTLLRTRNNAGTAELYERAIAGGEASVAEGGALVVRTGAHTGRSARDKFIVKDDETRDTVNWGSFNAPLSRARFGILRQRILDYLRTRQTFVQDLHAGADPDYRLNVRVVTEHAWHSLFSRHMLITPPPASLHHFEPQFTVIQAPGFQADPRIDGCRSSTAIAIDFAARMVLIAGTAYAGEIKKSVFTVLNYLLPPEGVLPMHCSVNVGRYGDAAVFFGLSGTGKTTLSADPDRHLVGDDEHGWSDSGLFNFEGGCYAKTIRLSHETEPEIYAAAKRFGTVLENVVMDDTTRQIDFDDGRLTENTRASYPLDFIEGASTTGQSGHPSSIILLTADAFGVMPPVARLTAEQATYHFLCGYTSKVAGTEQDVGKDPEATFSPCFGAPFMPRHPEVYARLLADRIRQQNVNCWLINTGWTGGRFGTGRRIPLIHTRAILNAALDGSLQQAAFRKDPHFGFEVPVICPGVPENLLDPRQSWEDKEAYDCTVRELCDRFTHQFSAFAGSVDAAVRHAGPQRCGDPGPSSRR